MRATKLMLLGILIMLLGISLAVGVTQAVALRMGVGFGIINTFPDVAAIAILIGFIVGLVGFFQKS